MTSLLLTSVGLDHYLDRDKQQKQSVMHYTVVDVVGLLREPLMLLELW